MYRMQGHILQKNAIALILIVAAFIRLLCFNKKVKIRNRLFCCFSVAYFIVVFLTHLC